MTRPSASERRDNSFDHLRLLAAAMVLVTHQYGALGAPAAWPLGIIGAWGVDMFFAMSGYLNTRSLLGRRSFAVFLASRALRIYPALILCVMFMVALGACVTALPWDEYFGRTTLDFFLRNSGLFLGQRGELPGVFIGNPRSGMNASLWTLPIEGRFYLYLAALLLIVRYSAVAISSLLIACCLALIVHGTDIPYENGSLRFVMVFGCGALIAALERISRAGIALVCAAATAILIYALGLTTAGLLAMLGVATIAVGQLPMPARLRLPLDISYGVYLFAFPIQQLTVMWGLSVYPGMLVAAVLTIVAAITSAVLVERPALNVAARLKREQPVQAR